MDLTNIPDDAGRIRVKATFTDDKGNEVAPAGPIVWGTSDPSKGIASTDNDHAGPYGYLDIIGPVGTFSLQATDGNQNLSTPCTVVPTAESGGTIEVVNS